MDLDAFNTLFDAIRPHLQAKDHQKGFASRGKVVEDEIRLAVALRWFAGGRAVDIADIFDLDKAMVYEYSYEVVTAINTTFSITFPTNDDQALSQLATSFIQKQHGEVLFDRCVGAVDGVHFKIISPRGNENAQVPLFFVQHPLMLFKEYFVPRKNEYAVLAQAGNLWLT